MTQVGQCAANETDTATAANMPKIAAINKVFIILIICHSQMHPMGYADRNWVSIDSLADRLSAGLKLILKNNIVPLIASLQAIDIFRVQGSR